MSDTEKKKAATPWGPRLAAMAFVVCIVVPLLVLLGALLKWTE